MSNEGKHSFLALIGQQPGERGRALKYDPAMCDKIKMFAQEGMFPEEWCAHIGISMTTLYRWANEHPEWEDAVVIGWHLLAAFYAKEARENLKNTDLKATLLLELMRKRFPSIWGKEPRGTQDHFEARDRGAADDQPLLDPDKMKHAKDEVISETIARLEERRRILREG